MQPYASFWRRLAAFLIDCLVISIPSSLLMGVLFFTRMPSLINALQTLEQTSDPSPEAFGTLMSYYGIIMLGNLLSLVIFWLYYAIMESSSKQATLGKMALGIKVVGPDGGRLSFGRATGRTLSKLISYTIIYFGFFMAAFTKKRQALHDIIAATYVVNNSFKQGDALPEEKFKPGCLILSIIVIVTPIILWVVFMFAVIASAFSQHANDFSAKTIADLTQAMKLKQSLIASGADENTLTKAFRYTLYADETGIHATPDSNPTAFSFYLPKGADEVCCLPDDDDCPENGPKICE